MFLNSNKLPAFTLVEALLYVALASVVLTVIAASLFQLLQLRTSSRIVFETEAQGQNIVANLKYELSQAESIISPGISVQSNELNYILDTVEKRVYLDKGKVMLEGVETIEMNSNNVIVSNLVFDNLSMSSEYDLVSISFDVTSNDSLQTSGQSYSTKFYFTQFIRSAK